MIEALRRFFETRAGMAIAGVLVLLSVIIGIGAIRGVLTSEAEDMSSARMFVDAQTQKPYRQDLELGMTIPAKAPSGGNTGYPSEACWWTKDGQKRSEPYYVILNTYLGKPEPTFCLDCGRLVARHNPTPAESPKAPPTKEEYNKRSPERK
jgi:hypothetical protein